MQQDMKVTIGILLGAIILFGGIIFFWSKKTNAPADLTRLIREDSHAVGPADAKVTIVEFADFQCPACAAQAPIINQLLKEYDGKIRYVYRHYPIRPNSNIAMNFAEAAGEQGKFFELGDAFFENQPEWGEKGFDPTELLTKYAKTVPGLDVTKVLTAVEDKKYDALVNRDTADATALNVNSTPTFFINGIIHRGVMPLADLRAAVEAELAK